MKQVFRRLIETVESREARNRIDATPPSNDFADCMISAMQAWNTIGSGVKQDKPTFSTTATWGGDRVEVKFGNESFAVLVRACMVTNAVETMLFGDVDAAKLYCNARWRIPTTEWEAYLVASDPGSNIKLNGEGVCYCGWLHYKDETETLHIHLESKIVEF